MNNVKRKSKNKQLKNFSKVKSHFIGQKINKHRCKERVFIEPKLIKVKEKVKND